MKNRTNTRWLTQLALLVAVLLVMNYTPLGYLQVGPLSMSLLTIPVAIGAMTLGPVAGAILGGVFGTTSFVSALRTPSVMSAAMLQASPVGTFITCFVARVLVGLCAGWVYIGIKKLLPKNTKLCCAVGASRPGSQRRDRRRGRCGNAAAEHLLVHAFAVRVLF